MPTLPDAGRLGGGPHAGPRRAQVRIGRTRPGTRGPGGWEVFAVGRGAGFVVLAEVTAGRPASCAWPMAARSGRPSRPRVAGSRPARLRPGVVRVLRRGTTVHAPNATNLTSGSEDAKVRRWNQGAGKVVVGVRIRWLGLDAPLAVDSGAGTTISEDHRGSLRLLIYPK